MITRIAIDGFKTFKNFSLDFEPFHVIIGPNASGKSNLFDALELLSKLATEDVLTAFRETRGTESEQFTLLPDGNHSPKMIITADFLLDKEIEDPYGGKSELKYTRLRYGIEITRTDDGLFITREQLRRINKSEDIWYDNHLTDSISNDHWEPEYVGGQSKLIYKSSLKDSNEPVIVLRGKADKSKPKVFKSSKLKKSVLSSVSGVEYAHAFAVKKELSQFKFLHLNPDKIRQPSSFLARTELTQEGENVAAVLNRLNTTNKYLLSDISRDISNLVPGVLDVRVRRNEPREQYEIFVKYEGGSTFSLPLVSEGTLRLLILSVLKNDLRDSQSIFLEEPENGVHISRLKKLLKLLSSMTTNFNSEHASHFPLRQLIINTHSIPLVKHLLKNENLFEEQLPGISLAEIFTHIDPEKKWKMKISKMESLTIAYGSIPYYKEEPNYLFSRLERLLNMENKVNLL